MKAWFLNLGPSSTTDKEANADINEILDTKPELLTGCEAIGKGDLPNDKDYYKERDASRPGRANLFAYVLKEAVGDRPVFNWTDCDKEFPRNGAAPGMHWARSIVQFPFQSEQLVVAHKPPMWRGAGPARYEHDRKLASILNPTPNMQRSRMLLWDSNGMNAAETLAGKVKGRVVGSHIDHAIVRKVWIQEHDYRRTLNGHKFATDHPWGGLVVTFRWNNG